MEVKTITDTQRAIQRRFFEAIANLKAQGTIGGLKPFCEENDLHWAKYSNLRSNIMDPGKESKYKILDIEALVYLVKNYNVSADWLLLGNDEILSRRPTYMFGERYGKEHEPIPFADRMSVPEASLFLNCSKTHLYVLVHKNKIPNGMFSHKIVFSKTELEIWMKFKKRQGRMFGKRLSLPTHDVPELYNKPPFTLPKENIMQMKDQEKDK